MTDADATDRTETIADPVTATRTARGTALVTGASSGIGAQYAEHLAARGHDLALVARREHRLQDLSARLRAAHGVAVDVVVADLADPADRERVVARVAGDDVTLLVNNAGINGYGPFHEVDPAVLTQVVELNVTAPTALARAAVDGMRRRGAGAVVNVASLLAFSGGLPPGPLPYRAVYAGTKAYLVTFSRALAAELEGSGVQVQVVCPGYTATEFHRAQGLEPVADDAQDRIAVSFPAMAAEDVVLASLAALATGEVVCVPGLADPVVVERLAEAEQGLRAGGAPRLAARYAG